MKLGYFPGCSLHATAREFDESLKQIVGPLGIVLDEVKDWACCGATSAHATNHLLSIALPARALAQAEEQKHDKMLAPCAACYSRLATARHELAANPQLAARVHAILGRPFQNTVQVLSIVELLRQVAPTIKTATTQPLKGLKVACYYGCLLVRPPGVTSFDDAEEPSSMEEVVKATGATPISWNKRLECCGGAFSIARTGSVVRLGREILEDAVAHGAQALVVACPMCHSNLDLRQQAMSQQRGEAFNLPILFLSQLVGLALGVPASELGMQRHFVATHTIATRSWDKALPAAREAV